MNLYVKDHYIVLIKPDIHVSTKKALSSISPAFPKYNLSRSIKRPVSEWRNLIKNDFEKSVFAIYPQIGEIKDTLYNIGALYSSMSGSGSSVYGIFCEKPNIDNLFDRCFVWQGKCRI